MFDINTVNNEINIKGALINAPEDLLSVPSSPVGDGTKYVEITGQECFYVSSERGVEYNREKIKDLDHLLYLIFDRVTFRMACSFELNNRIENQDFRRIVFSRQLELLQKLDPKWAELTRQDIEKTLEDTPYEDE